MLANARDNLAAQQTALVAALTNSKPALEGFELSRLKAAADALLRKRRRGVAKAWPTLASALGKSFIPQFAAYAEATPLPAHGGSLADGRRFASRLADRQLLPDAVRIEMLNFDLRYSLSETGLAVRVWPQLKAIWLGGDRRLLVAMRLPWLRICSFSISLGIFAGAARALRRRLFLRFKEGVRS